MLKEAGVKHAGVPVKSDRNEFPARCSGSSVKPAMVKDTIPKLLKYGIKENQSMMYLIYHQPGR
jgi:hypothetical protein